MWAEGAGVERERRLTTRTPTYIRSYKSISVCVEWDAPLLCQWYSCVTWKKITHLSFCLNGARYMLFDHVHQVFGCALKSRCIHGVELSMLSPKTLFRCVCGDSAGLIQPPIIHPIHHHIINVITSADEMFPAPYSVSPLRLLLMSYASHPFTYVRMYTHSFTLGFNHPNYY